MARNQFAYQASEIQERGGVSVSVE